MRELRLEAEAERKALAAELLASLGREPTAIDRVAVEALSAALIRARRLRSMGKDDSEQTRLIAQLLRTTGIKPDKPAAKPADPSASAVEWLNSFKKPSTDAAPSDRTAVAAPSDARTSGPSSGHSVDGAV